jgi:hypothetical protein
VAENKLDIEDLNHLYIEVIMGIGPEGSNLPDTPLVREKRAILQKEVDEIKARGHTPDVPFL